MKQPPESSGNPIRSGCTGAATEGRGAMLTTSKPMGANWPPPTRDCLSQCRRQAVARRPCFVSWPHCQTPGCARQRAPILRAGLAGSGQADVSFLLQGLEIRLMSRTAEFQLREEPDRKTEREYLDRSENSAER